MQNDIFSISFYHEISVLTTTNVSENCNSSNTKFKWL